MSVEYLYRTDGVKDEGEELKSWGQLSEANLGSGVDSVVDCDLMFAAHSSEFHIPTFAAIALVVCSRTNYVVGVAGVGEDCECVPVPFQDFDILATESAIAIVGGNECFFAQKCGAFTAVGDVGDLNAVAKNADGQDELGEG